MFHEAFREAKKVWQHHVHEQPHSLPHGCPQAGAQWSPDVQPFDRNLPVYPVLYSDEEKQGQREALDQLRPEFERAVREEKEFTIPPGVYRLSEPLILEGTEDFTLDAADVELVMEAGLQHFRVLSNRNLTVRGPLVLDAEPFGWTQGDLIEVDPEALTLTVQLWEGYRFPEQAERIHFYTQEGILLPHGQDAVQNIEDLGGHVVRLTMNPFTWSQHVEHADEILRPGNLLAIETKGCGGLEMRENTGTLWEDVGMHTHGLCWAGPEYGEDVFVRWQGTRRRGTNRLAGGGFHLMSFFGGGFTLLDSEIGHNFDDLNDCNTYQTFAFHQVGPRQFHIMDDNAKPGHTLCLHDYTNMECFCDCRVEAVEEQPDAGVRETFKELAERFNVRDLGEVKLCTIDRDVQLPDFSFVAIQDAITQVMRFERNYLHDGLSAGINPKGAHSVIIKDNIVERAAGFGIAVSFDPYWWEGNPSRNIEIVGNTVRNSPYAPPMAMHDAITVYAGGSHDGMPGPEAAAQLHENVLIANNAVYTAGACGISVKNARDVTIIDNVLTDTNQAGGSQSSIYVNAVSHGTRIMGNIFAGADASAEAVQIRTGPHTDPCSVVCENNRSANPEVLVPERPWRQHHATDDGLELQGEGWHLEGGFPHQQQLTGEHGAAAVFRFEGSRVRVLSLRAPWVGQADVFVDDQFSATVDGSRPLEEKAGVLYTSPVLPEGEHWLRVVNRAEPGRFTAEDRACLSIHGVDVLSAWAGECQWDPRAGPQA